MRELLERLAAAVGALAAAVALWESVRRRSREWRAGRRRQRNQQRQFLADWHGEQARPGVPARPGVMVRLASIESAQTALAERMGNVEKELHPNSGHSFRDAVDRAVAGVPAGTESR